MVALLTYFTDRVSGGLLVLELGRIHYIYYNPKEVDPCHHLRSY